MTARDDYAFPAAVADGRVNGGAYGREETAAALDEIDQLRAWNAAWIDGVANIVEPLGYDRNAACGPADLLPGLRALVRNIRAYTAVNGRDIVGNLRDVAEADESDDLSTCPYFARYESLPGHDPDGQCDRGCYDEPQCVTCEPSEGWPSLKRRAVCNEAADLLASSSRLAEMLAAALLTRGVEGKDCDALDEWLRFDVDECPCGQRGCLGCRRGGAA